MKLFTMIFVSFALLLGGLPLEAQNQSGSEAIADQIRPANENRMSEFTECVVTLTTKASFKAEEAAKQCKEIAKIAAAEAMKIANEAADATKASRPLVVSPYGYGYRGYYYGRSYGSWGIRIGGRSHIIHRSYPRRNRR